MPQGSYIGCAIDELLRVANCRAGETSIQPSTWPELIEKIIQFCIFLTDAMHQNANANTSYYRLQLAGIARTLFIWFYSVAP